MFDIRWIRDNAAAFDEGRAKRGLQPASADLIGLDDRRRGAIARLEALQARRNAAAKEIGRAMGRKDTETAERLKTEVATLKADVGTLETDERDASAALDAALAESPNLPLDDVPVGADEHGNVEMRRSGQRPAFPEGFAPREHFALGEDLGLMDFESAAKMSGARFVVLRGALARLHRALGQFMLDLHVDEHGYTEIQPPLLVRDPAMFGTAQLPKFFQDQFAARDGGAIREEFLHATRGGGMLALERAAQYGLDEAKGFFESDLRFVKSTELPEDYFKRLWLIPTAEVPLTNLARERIIEEKSLPLRFTALTPSFRAEAGAAGRDTRGMIRQHQFDKVELVSITTPDTSQGEHERMTAAAEEVLKRLGLHYRVMLLCTGDMGFASRKTYDIEVWLPGQGAFREISSCSICGEFQARRMEARFRPEGGKSPRFVHTLNGSGVAVGRALVAVMENYQGPDGSIAVPEVLRPYMGGTTEIKARPKAVQVMDQIDKLLDDV